MAKNRVIGRDGHLPWHIPEDLKRFKQLTMGHHIVMGRKTWESLGRLLPGRRHVIVSRQAGYSVTGAQVVQSLDAALAACTSDDEIFIIGGGEIYRQALPVTDRIYLTEVAMQADGDTVFPELQAEKWFEAAREPKGDSASAIDYTFLTLERRGLMPPTAQIKSGTVGRTTTSNDSGRSPASRERRFPPKSVPAGPLPEHRSQ